MNRLPPWYPRATWGMTLGLLISLALLLLMRPGVIGPLATALEYDTLDFWFALREPKASRDVGLLVVDGNTLRGWNGQSFNARDVARTLAIVKKAGAKGIALHFPNINPEQMRSQEAEILARSIRENGPVTLPLEFWKTDAERPFEARPKSGSEQKKAKARFGLSVRGLPIADGARLGSSWNLNAPPLPLSRVAAGAGHLNFFFDRFGRVRNLPLYLEWQGRFFPAFSVAASETRGRLLSLPNQSQSEGDLMLNYPYGAPGSGAGSPFPTLSVRDLLRFPSKASLFKGRVVVIGTVAPGVSSRYPTPTGGFITATELQAVALDNLLSGAPLQHAPEIYHWLFTILPGIIVGGFSATRRPSWSAPVALLCIFSVTIASFGLFRSDLWLDTSVPWLTIAITFLVGVIGRARVQERDATHIESTVEALTRVSDIVAAQTRPGNLMDKVLQFAAQTLRTSGAAALLWDNDRQHLTFAAAIGTHSDSLLGVKIRSGEGVAGAVAQSGEALIINDVKADTPFSARMDERTGFSTRNLICVPLKVGEQILGVIEVVNREGNRPFTAADARLLQALANQAAIALENSRLYERLGERVEQSQGALAVANRQLQADKNLLQTVLHSMTDGVVVTDGGGRIQLLNPAAQGLLPELNREVLGSPLGRVLEDFPLAQTGVPAQRLSSESVVLYRGDPDSPRQIEGRAAPLQSPDGEFAGLVAAFSDVTQRRELEQAKSDFVSFVAHEMRSPLTSISGFSSMLARAEQSGQPLPHSTRTRFLALIREESERLTRLINSLLDVAKLEAGRRIELHRDDLDFAQVAGVALESQRAYSTRHTLVTQFDPALPLVHADADKVIQILINLLSNALKYSPGGTVTLGATRAENHLKISVSDEGPGISPEGMAVLFSRFGRTPQQATGAGARSKPTGTGLGLFLTKHLVEAHGGQIWVESQPGQGATFFFTLPLAKKED